jgi:hypothetical protein
MKQGICIYLTKQEFKEKILNWQLSMMEDRETLKEFLCDGTIKHLIPRIYEKGLNNMSVEELITLAHDIGFEDILSDNLIDIFDKEKGLIFVNIIDPDTNYIYPMYNSYSGNEFSDLKNFENFFQ